MTASDDKPDLDRAKANYERALAVAEAGSGEMRSSRCRQKSS
jgi:hypothetical protein